MPTRPTIRDPLDKLSQDAKALKGRVKQQENRRFRTLPIYESGQFPEDAVEGQVALTLEDGELTLWGFINGAWMSLTGTGGGSGGVFGVFWEDV